MSRAIGRSLIVWLFAVAGCSAPVASQLGGGAEVESARSELTASPGAASEVVPEASSACLLLCKQTELRCMQGCMQNPNGGDCGCTEDYLACRGTC